MKRKTITILICLALMSLACLQTAMVAQSGAGEPTSSAVVETETVAVEISPSPFPSPAGGWERCAQVTASKSLNLRSGASEHSQIIAWLESGDIVSVTDQSDSEWWKISTGDLSGYVKARYLAESECEQ